MVANAPANATPSSADGPKADRAALPSIGVTAGACWRGESRARMSRGLQLDRDTRFFVHDRALSRTPTERREDGVFRKSEVPCRPGGDAGQGGRGGREVDPRPEANLP